MSTCAVCNAKGNCVEVVDEVCRIDEQYVLVGGIPAEVCVRRGEQSFSRETAEKVRLTVHGEAKATTPLPMQVFDFTS